MVKPRPSSEVELHPDAWARFERAAGVVVKAPPQHRTMKKSKKRVAPKKKSKAAVKSK